MIVRELLTLLGFDLDEKGAAQYERRTEQTQRKVERATTAIGRAWEKASRAADAGLARMDKGLERVQSGAQGVANNMGGLATALGAGLGTAWIVDTTSTFTDLQSRLKIALDTTTDGAAAMMDRLHMAARAARTSTDGAVESFLQMKPGLDELNVSLEDQVKLLTSVSDSMTVGGITGQKAAQTQFWLNRAFTIGKVSTEVFNGLLENGDDLLNQMAKSMGKSRGELLDMAKAGTLTARTLADHFLKVSDQMRADAEDMPWTLRQVFARMKDNLDVWLFGVDRATGATNAFGKALLWLADRPMILGTAALGVIGLGAGAMAAQFVASGIAVIRSLIDVIRWMRVAGNTARAMNAAMAFGKFVGLLTLVAGLQDLIVWTRGGESVIGRLVGRLADLEKKPAAQRKWWENWALGVAGYTKNVDAAGAATQQLFANASNPPPNQIWGDWFKQLAADAEKALFGSGGWAEWSPITIDEGGKAAQAIDWLKGKFDQLATEAGGAWETIKTKLVGELTGGIENVKASWTGMVDGAQGAFGSAVDWMITKWGEFKAFMSDNALVNGAKGLANKAAEAMGFDAPFAGTVSPQMPAHADGTRSAGRGLALVGEEGPEIVRFGGGEQVIPAAPSSRMLEALAANARGFAQRAADFSERFATDFAGMQGRLAAPGLAAGGATPNPAAGLHPVGGTLAATVNVGGIKVEVTAAETGGMSPEALGDLVAKRVKGEMAGVAEGVFAKEIRRATRHFTEAE